MAEIFKMNDDTYRIEDAGVRFFVLIGGKNALVIDSGMNTHDAKEIVKSITDLPPVLVNTHADPDHIAGNKAFGEFFMNHREKENYRQHGGEGIIKEIKEGDVIDIGGRKLEATELPGHTAGSIGLIERDRRILFPGDVVQDGNVFMFGARRNMEDYIKSLEKLEKMSDTFECIFPSHGTIPLKGDHVTKMKEAAKKILAGTETGTPMNLFGNEVLLYKSECAGFLCDKK